MNALRECPFCGSTDFDVGPHETRDGAQYFAVHCDPCAAEGPRDQSETEARRLWNCRGDALEAEKTPAPFDPWTLPEVGPEYEVMLNDSQRGPGCFVRLRGLLYYEGPLWPDRLSFRDVRVWRKL